MEIRCKACDSILPVPSTFDLEEDLCPECLDAIDSSFYQEFILNDEKCEEIMEYL